MNTDDDILAGLPSLLAALDEEHKQASKEAALKGEEIHRLRMQLEQAEKLREAKETEIMEANRTERELLALHALPPATSSLPEAIATVQTAAPQQAQVVLPSGPSEMVRRGTAFGVASASTDAPEPPEAPAPRWGRVLLGACMPHGLPGGAQAILRQVLALFMRISAFAEVRIVITKELTKVDGAERLDDEVQNAARRTQRASLDGSPAEASGVAAARVFSYSDQQQHPYECAAELARWADVLLIAPLCASTLALMNSGIDNDLLLEIVQLWASEKKKGRGGHYWVCQKPFLVCPRMPPERRKQLIVEQQMTALKQTGVTVMPDPGDNATTVHELHGHIEEVVEQTRHHIMQKRGLVQLPPPPPPPPLQQQDQQRQSEGGAKRRRVAS
jgi:hypothetical protein